MNIKDGFTGIQHLGIPTEDLEKTIAFYGRIGFSVTWRNETVAFLKLGNLVIETYQVPCAAKVNGAIDHVAINVKDVYAAYDFAKAQSFDIIPSQSPTGVDALPFFQNGVSFFTIIGPNGEKVEFNQML